MSSIYLMPLQTRGSVQPAHHAPIWNVFERTAIDGSKSGGENLLMPAVNFKISSETAFGALEDGLYATEMALSALEQAAELVDKAKVLVDESAFGPRYEVSVGLKALKQDLVELSKLSLNGDFLLNDSLIGSGMKVLVTSVKFDDAREVLVDASPLDIKRIALVSDRDVDVGILSRAHNGYHFLSSDTTFQASSPIEISGDTTFAEIDNMSLALAGIQVGLMDAQRYVRDFQAKFVEVTSTFLDWNESLSGLKRPPINSNDDAGEAAKNAVFELRRQAMSITYGVPGGAGHLMSLLR